MEKILNWILGILATITGFIVVDNIRFRKTISEKYILKEDFLRVMNENREDHRIIVLKCDDILEKLGRKVDRI